MTTTLILDFDGTLANTTNLIVKTLQETLTTEKHSIRSFDECAATIGLPLSEAFKILANVNDARADELATIYRKIFAVNNVPGAVTLYPTVKETLLALKNKGIRLTIATSRARPSLEILLKDLDIFDLISYTLTGLEVPKSKPAPDMVLHTMNHFNLRTEECIVVGDAKVDILMGHNAGVKAIAVNYGNGSEEDLKTANPEHIISEFAQILNFI